MGNTFHKDLEAIEDLHLRDVTATKAGDISTLKSLMDGGCMVFPPDSEPEVGQVYLDSISASADGIESQPLILELTQDWEEINVFGDFAYELGVVRYSVQTEQGTSIRELQRIMRILRRQPDGTWKVFRAMWHMPLPAVDEMSEGLAN